MCSNFPTSLFDFDFSDCEAATGRDFPDNLEYEAMLMRAYRATHRDEPSLAPRSEDPEELSERLTALRRLADRAFSENRMGAYFRLLDSIEAYPACVCESTPSMYGIPEVKLSYVSDPGLKSRPKILSSSALSDAFRASFGDGEIEFCEQFKVAYLDRSNRVLGICTVGKGGLSCCPVDLRVLYTGALLAHACQIALCHNHPSGNLNSSPEDDALTRKIMDAGKVLQILVIDHIILSDDGYMSYRDCGKI